MTAERLWTDETAAEATGGQASAPFEADGVAFDSRQVGERDLFVALKGRRADGHGHVGHAFEQGAAAAMVCRQPEGVPERAPLLLVLDTSNGLDDLARAARARSRARIAAVTGSVGKTGTKEALRHVLSRQGGAHASEKSFNNHVGTPLSLARMPPSARFGVFEIGTGAPGEIGPLAALVRPHVAVVTTVEAVHLGNFADEEAIAREKASLFDGLEEDGTALVNGDNRHAPLLTRLALRSGRRVERFGSGGDCAHRLLAWTPQDDGSRVEAEIAGRRVRYRLALAGRHLALGSVAVLAAVHRLGGDVAAAAHDLASLRPLAGRGRRHRIATADGHATVIDESYNASPAAVRAALAVLAAAAPEGGGRRIAVLGDMLELGAGEEAAHAGLAADVVAGGVDLLFAVGPLMHRLYDAVPPARRGGAACDARAMAALLGDVVRPGDVVLVKGSRRVGLEAAVEALVDSAAPSRRAGRG